ncbi:MAG TPA: cytochrome b/b6 domain-containing protein [Dehalococcoidia bacterium]|nr:cytochrome b/b6 domain-containing protein [Dehalococcoidia bacterium]
MTAQPSLATRPLSTRRPALFPQTRVPHLSMLASILVLAATGLPQKFDSLGPSEWIMDTAGGIETLRAVHHAAGAVLIVAATYHVCFVLYALLVKHRFGLLAMVPDAADFRDAVATMLYFLGLRPQRPVLRDPTYLQKLDYWAMFWGLVVMMFTGIVRLFPDRATAVLSGNVVAAALEAHSDIAALVVTWVAAFHLAYMRLAFRPSAHLGRQGATSPEPPAPGAP